MNVAILGFDLEGRASYEYFAGRGDTITICDQQADKVVPEGATAVLGESYLDDLERFDLLIRTPSLKPSAILDKNPGIADKITNKITSGTNEFIKNASTQNIIGVTGTKGKGTTSTLIAKMLEASGKTVHLAGNIGVPALSLMPNITPDDWVVLELSSFQLIDLKHSPHMAVCLMVVPEHLDWHRDVEEYITAKEQLFARQGTADIAIYFHENETSKRIAGAGQAQKIPYYHSPGAEVVDGAIVIDGQTICQTSELKLLGQHNWQNACAAVTAAWYACLQMCDTSQLQSPDIDAIRSVLTSFAGLPYRIEFRREANGIRYYNDSFASAPPAPIAALEAVPETAVVIIGGYDRNLDLGELVAGLQRNSDKIRSVLIIGAAAQRIAASFSAHGFTNFTISTAKTMSEIVRQATALAKPGEAVILSPGFPSFDMFKNFEDRGRQFNQVVEVL